MFQVTFSDQAMNEMNKLSLFAQLEAVEPISSLKASDLAKPREPLGKFNRGGQTYYRLRCGEHRFYFQLKDGDVFFVRYILTSHTLEDFLLRNGLPVTEEQLVEQQSHFWSYLESLTKR